MAAPSPDSPVRSGVQDRAPSGGAPAFSVVVPMLNEAENVAPLIEEIDVAMQPLGSYEIVAVDDGSSDGTGDLLDGLRSRYPALRLVRHPSRCGQSAALRSGALAARGDWIATLDGDGQNDPRDIALLVNAARTAGAPVPALVGGLRRERRDSLSKRLASRFANGLRQGLLRDDCADSGCGLKLIHRAVLMQLPYFNALHRFAPALVKRLGYRTRFVEIGHRPRLRGTTKYTNLQRGLIGLIDLFGVIWLMRRIKVPAPPAPPAPGGPPPPRQDNED